jgi:glucose-6-phosphate 1-dehydrogenase
MLHDCLFIILGATGDLTKRKLIPAIYKLVASGEVGHFAILGVSVDQTDMSKVFTQARTFVPEAQEDVWQRLEANAAYFCMDFNNAAAYANLSSVINALEQTYELSGNRLFYLATMPHHFISITQNLTAQKMVIRNDTPADAGSNKPWQRIVYEKPFGDSLASSREINQAIASVLDEQQVFRIDHWLGKELVSNIALARFTNHIFEPLWHHEHIESVQIVVSESIGIEGRSAFFDTYGLLKDMVQNHMLQILALVAMEGPAHFTANDLRDAKAAVLSKVTIENAIFGQYNGYLQEPGVPPTSQTETFVALKAWVHTPRWTGVPFYLKTGKYLDKTAAAVHIKFKQVKCLLDVCPTDTNYLTINIQPNEGMHLVLNVKKPGVFNQVIPVAMGFSHRVLFGPNTPAAYEVLLGDVIKGDQCAFVRADEIDYSWQIVQQVSAENRVMHSYQPGSTGPAALDMLDSERKIIWKT